MDILLYRWRFIEWFCAWNLDTWWFGVVLGNLCDHTTARALGCEYSMRAQARCMELVKISK